MEKINILISDDAALYLDDLVKILYNKDYFGFIESAELYMFRIYEFIDQNIQYFPSKVRPNELYGYGENYIFYKINPRTTWYIFFQKSDNNYLVTQVINNHCQEAKYL